LAAHADLIERRCQGVALGGMLISNQAHLKAALQRLRYWQAREGCLCALNPLPVLRSASPEQGQMQLLSLQEAEDGGAIAIPLPAALQPALAGIDREYHYPWWDGSRPEGQAATHGVALLRSVHPRHVDGIASR
jgi:hypothetical protein